jgi:hypothetical protein
VSDRLGLAIFVLGLAALAALACLVVLAVAW